MFPGRVGGSVSSCNLAARRFESFSGIFVLLEQEDHYKGENHFFRREII